MGRWSLYRGSQKNKFDCLSVRTRHACTPKASFRLGRLLLGGHLLTRRMRLQVLLSNEDEHRLGWSAENLAQGNPPVKIPRFKTSPFPLFKTLFLQIFCSLLLIIYLHFKYSCFMRSDCLGCLEVLTASGAPLYVYP